MAAPFFLAVPALSLGFLLNVAVEVALQMADDFLMPSAGALLLLIDACGAILILL